MAHLQRCRSKSSRARPFPALRSVCREARDGRMLYSSLSLANAVPASRVARSNVLDKGNSVQWGSVTSRASFDGSPIANSPLRNRFIGLCGTARRPRGFAEALTSEENRSEAADLLCALIASRD